MENFIGIFNFFLNIDTHLGEIIASHGGLSYIVLFVIIFAETGFVFAPFLPGDSLLFIAGAFSAMGSFNIVILLILFWIATFLGDTVNYWIGRSLGQKIINNPKIPINQEHINKTQKFYNKHGGKTIILARFSPIIRTFAPFIAGMGKMSYKKFAYYNTIGEFIWVFGFTLLGYFFGNFSVIKENFSIVIFVIVVLSFLPMLIEFARTKFKKVN
ncbi:MAG: DedA family protein [Erysipelotrichaceae bacterium]|nr:DedA family protein [Erysipelotrichaceae bacterium]